MKSQQCSINYTAKLGQVNADFLAYEVRENRMIADYIKELDRVQTFYDHLRVGLFGEVIEWLKDIGAYRHLLALKEIMTLHEIWSDEYERVASF